MTAKALFCAIGELSEEYILDAAEENIRTVSRARRIGRAARRIGAIAACLILLFGAGIYGYFWYNYDFTAHEEMLKIYPVYLENRMMSYAAERIGEGEALFLPTRIGEEVWSSNGKTFYRFKGRDDYAELILDDGGTLSKVSFYTFSMLPEGGIYSDEDGTDWHWRELVPEEVWQEIDTSPYTYRDILRVIYRVDDADDIAWVRFEKSNIDNTQIGRSVKVKTVTLRDADEIETVWDILVSISGTDHYAERPEPRVPLPDDVRSVQVVRNVTVSFKNGVKLEFEYTPSGGEDCGLFYRIEGVDYYYLTVEQNHALIDLAEISFAPTPIPETEPPSGTCVTATAASFPDETIEE